MHLFFVALFIAHAMRLATTISADGTGIGDIVGRLRWNIFIAVNAFSHSENLYGATSRDLLGSALSLT